MPTDDADRTTRAAYEAAAAAYAARSEAVFEKAWIARHLALLEEVCPPPARVLALGAGTGQEIAALESAGYEVIGLDVARAMLAEAADRTDAPLVQADMRALPFAPGGFDAAWASMSLLHLPRADVEPTLRALGRVVAPGGTLYATVKAGTGEELLDWRGGRRRFTYFRPDAFADTLEAAGFVPTHQHVEPSETTAGQDVLVHLARAGRTHTAPRCGR